MDYFVHESSYIDKDVSIGVNSKIWHFTHVQSGAVIGNNCSLGQNVNISNNVRIGNGVKIQNNVSVYEGVELEDYVFCGPSMVFTNDINPRSKFSKGRLNYKRTLVREGATLGANCTIICGNIIGKWSMIAAGSVVTNHVKDYALIVGVPGKQVGWVCECGEKLESNYTCSSCERKYTILEDDSLIKIEGENCGV
ncbi:MAG: N-acetyltransferase [Firmicutes bacterium]|jgi:UDP-2-acetamido-3-amino-2,3-dideoxy-glucuronate N-acetyltransferase|nr:N-acetyltransferase [Bacillota bacterium]